MKRSKFNTLVQNGDQSNDKYLTELKKQAQNFEFICAYEQCKKSYEDRMVQDRLIVGIKCKESQLTVQTIEY